MNAVQIRDQDPSLKGIRELLTMLEQKDLASLLGTLSNHLVQFGSVPRDENGKPLIDATSHAINSILMYSDYNIQIILDRSKVTKAYLAAYLNQKGVRMTTPATKTTLARDCLNYWGHPASEVQPRPDNTLSSGAGASANSATSAQQGQSYMVSSPGSQPVVNGSDSAVVPQNYDLSNNTEHENTVSMRQRQSDLGQKLGMEFASWFYERLNTLTDFTTAHFWSTCNFRLEIIFAADPNSTVIDEIMMNGEATCAKIKDLVAVKSLYFNPEKSDTGVRGFLNPHGLAQVMVCGVLHSNGSPVGVFEQMFGLMKDPSATNNFKIKFSVLRLREGSFLAIQGAPPQLHDSSLVGIVEEIDEDDD